MKANPKGKAMSHHHEVVWTFKTRNFHLELQISECLESPRGQFDDEDDVAAIESGDILWFDAAMIVYGPCGMKVGSDYLGCCAYEKISDFIAHGEKGYFGDMVRNAVAHARENLAEIPKLRVKGE